MRISHLLNCALSSLLITTPTLAQDVPGPDPIQPGSGLRVALEHVGTMPQTIGPGLLLGTQGPNLQSPVPADNAMYFIDHYDAVYAANKSGKGLRKIFSIADGDAPDGLIFEMKVSDGSGGEIDYKQRQAVFNVAPGKDDKSVYMVLVANVGSELPDVPRYQLPPPESGDCCFLFGDPPEILDLYNIDPKEPADANFFIPFVYPGIEHQILYEFTDMGGKLGNPRPIAIFDSQGGPLHHGGALLTVPDGRVLFWTGDAVPFGLSGLAASQDETSHLSKILLIDPDTGDVEVAASGVRNVQHAEFVKLKNLDEPWVAFADIGGWTAEEVNTVRLADLLDTSVVENFGWGVNLFDGRAREGTFYVATDGPGSMAFTVGTPAVLGHAPSPEPGFVQPYAQYERPVRAPAPGDGDPLGGLASTGPVTSKSFRSLKMVFSDLSSGRLYGTTAPLDTIAATIYALTIEDENGQAYETLLELTGLPRVDPRFFQFPDGGAGLLLEATGDYYRLTEIR